MFVSKTKNRPLSYGTEYYYVLNLQGDVMAILDGDGDTVVSYTYDAWGSIVSTDGSQKDTLGFYNPLRYRGYVYDTETGLYYLQSRYYNPSICRFLNADAFTSTGQGLLGNNMFAYCNNNPVNYSDPSGYTPDYPGEPGYEWAWDIGWWIKEKIEEYKKKKEERKKSVTYTPKEDGRGAEIGNAYNITNIFEMYEFIIENRGDEIGGSNTGVVVEWVFHNIAYMDAVQKGDQETMKQAGTVDIGYTIFDDNHGIKTAAMIGLYRFVAPYIFTYDYNVAILKE